MWVGRIAKPNSSLDFNTRFILNTFEQFTAYLVAIAVVALYSPIGEARALPILTMHLLPNGGGLYLVCLVHRVWSPHPALLALATTAAFARVRSSFWGL